MDYTNLSLDDIEALKMAAPVLRLKSALFSKPTAPQTISDMVRATLDLPEVSLDDTIAALILFDAEDKKTNPIHPKSRLRSLVGSRAGRQVGVSRVNMAAILPLVYEHFKCNNNQEKIEAFTRGRNRILELRKGLNLGDDMIAWIDKSVRNHVQHYKSDVRRSDTKQNPKHAP